MSEGSQPVRNVERPVGRRRSWPPAPDQGGDQFDLAAALAHDLRSPVAAIQILAEGLQQGEGGPVNLLQHRRLGLIRSAAFSLCVLASDVEELARGRHLPLDGEPRPFSIRDVFADVEQVVAPLREAKVIALRFDTPSHMVDHRLGFPGVLRRVVLNLAMNALQATDAGSVTIAALPRDQRRVEFSVSDTGTGIDTHSLAVGLGLSICRDLLDGLGSGLKMASQAGVGTRVRFTLDLPPAPVAEIAP